MLSSSWVRLSDGIPKETRLVEFAITLQRELRVSRPTWVEHQFLVYPSVPLHCCFLDITAREIESDLDFDAPLNGETETVHDRLVIRHLLVRGR